MTFIKRLKLAAVAVVALSIGTFLSLTPASAAVSPTDANHTCVAAGSPQQGLWTSGHGYAYPKATGFCINHNGARLVFWTDGNLILYRTATNHVQWTSNTSGRGATLKFQTDGNVVIYDKNNVPIWNTGKDKAKVAFHAYKYDYNVDCYSNGCSMFVLHHEVGAGVAGTGTIYSIFLSLR